MSEKVVAIAAKHIQTSWFNVVMSMKYACGKGVLPTPRAHASDATTRIECIFNNASHENTHAVTEAFPDAFLAARDRFELLLGDRQILTNGDRILKKVGHSTNALRAAQIDGSLVSDSGASNRGSARRIASLVPTRYPMSST